MPAILSRRLGWSRLPQLARALRRPLMAIALGAMSASLVIVVGFADPLFAESPIPRSAQTEWKPTEWRKGLRQSSRKRTAPQVTITTPSRVVTGDTAIGVMIGYCVEDEFSSPTIEITQSTDFGSADITGDFGETEGGTPPGCSAFDHSVWLVGEVALQRGHNYISVTLDDNGNSDQNEKDYYRPWHQSSVAVITPSQRVEVAASASVMASFTVTNTGAGPDLFSLDAGCSGSAVNSCSLSPSTITLNAGQSGTATISYTAGSLGQTGSLVLVANNNSAPGSDQTWQAVTVVATPSAGGAIATTLTGAGEVFERGLCLATPIVPSMAVQCGDLVVTHALPTTTTLGVARTPILRYTTQQAYPTPIHRTDLVAASVPDSVRGTLTLSGVGTSYASWSGSDFLANKRHRVAMPVPAAGLPTGLHPYAIEYRAWTGGSSSVYGSWADTIAVVNRGDSPFGSGWWLDELEQLIISGGTIMWVGGDGSTRRYHNVATNVWIAENVTRVDSLTSNGTDYQRRLGNGARVDFNSLGQQVARVDRLGYSTTYSYTTVNGTSVLSTITLPVVSGSAPIYTFNYDGSARLTSVDAPHPSGSGSRSTLVRPDGGNRRLRAIVDPIGDSVRFTYDGAYTTHIVTHVDRRQYGTTILYDIGRRVASDTLTNGSQKIAHGYLPMETAGLPGSQRPSALPLDSVYTQIDGPRTDSADVSRVWFDGYGNVSRTRNPLGRERHQAFTNGTFPGLVTQTRSGSNFVTNYFYGSRGLMDSVVQIDPTGSSASAKTQFVWHSSLNLPSEIITPLGANDGTHAKFFYNSSNGNLDSTQVGRDSTRVRYTYHGSGLLATTKAPGIIRPDSNGYSALGNLLWHRATSGQVDSTITDAAGRVVRSRRAIDGSNFARSTYAYDIQDRDTTSVNYGPAMNGAPADSAILRKVYDKGGNVAQIDRHRGVRFPSGPTLTSSYMYDGRGRLVNQSVGGRVDSLVYDPAGNVLTHIAPLGQISYVYDRANQLRRRIVPEKTYDDCPTPTCPVAFPTTGAESLCIAADTSHFTYDGEGRIRSAMNIHSRVTRVYSPAGYVIDEIQNVRTFGSSGNTCETDSQPLPGSEWTWVTWELPSSYDLDGRRTFGGNAIYEYDGAGRGLLTKVIRATSPVTSTADTALFSYDAAGRLKSTALPGAMNELRAYHDTTGRLYARTVDSASTVKLRDSLWYDFDGRITDVSTKFALAGDTVSRPRMTYTGLGALDSIRNHMTDGRQEYFQTDAHGNRTRKARPGYTAATGDSIELRKYTYDSNGRLTTIADSAFSTESFTFGTSISYDAAGNMTLNSTTSSGLPASHLMAYYSIDDKLVIANRAVSSGAGGVYEEHRYDALGRRVLSRAEFAEDCDPGTYGSQRCAHRIEVTAWDGDQIIGQSRVGGTGVGLPVQGGVPGIALGAVSYVHAFGIDQPVMVRTDSTVVPFKNWSGDFLFGTINGLPEGLGEWPAGASTADGETPNSAPASRYMGSLIGGQRDGSGLMYRRNRYYNPSLGQFTQVDPSGLAGGSTLYGFGSGDPVNFRDPFGLEPCSDAELSSGRETVANKGGAICVEGRVAFDKYQQACSSSILEATASVAADLSMVGGASRFAYASLKHGFFSFTRSNLAHLADPVLLGRLARAQRGASATASMAGWEVLGGLALDPTKSTTDWTSVIPVVGSLYELQDAYADCTNR